MASRAPALGDGKVTGLGVLGVQVVAQSSDAAHPKSGLTACMVIAVEMCRIELCGRVLRMVRR